jgi:LacI family transcriptional regulator
LAGNGVIYCEGHSPKISSINLDNFKIGYEAAKMMDLMLQGKELPERHIVLPPENMTQRESTDTYAVDDQIVKEALRFIADNFNRSLQIVDVVAQVPLARRTLEERFKKVVGSTIIDEINRHRVTSLKRLLLETDLNINKLHGRLGFSCPQHMRRVFEKSRGMTPGEYRSKS